MCHHFDIKHQIYHRYVVSHFYWEPKSVSLSNNKEQTDLKILTDTKLDNYTAKILTVERLKFNTLCQ